MGNMSSDRAAESKRGECKKTCASCAYYEAFLKICGNGQSENYAGFMIPNEYCPAWAGNLPHEKKVRG